MFRWLASLIIVALLALDVALPYTPLGRRGHETRIRMDAPDAVGEVGAALPDFALRDLDGRLVRLSDFRGRRVLLTLERSVDW